MCPHLLTPETRHRRQIKTAWDSGQFPATDPRHALDHTEHPLPHQELQHGFPLGQRLLWWRTSASAGDRAGSDPALHLVGAGVGQSSLGLTEAADQDGLEL